MFDNLIARAIVPVSIAVTGFVIFGCLLLYSFIKTDMTEEALRHVDGLVETVVRSTHYAMLKNDRDSLRNIIANVATLEGVERVRIYDQDGVPVYADLEGVTAPGSAAVKVDQWTAPYLQQDHPGHALRHRQVDHNNGFIAVSVPILNEPKCATAACHFHAEEEPILGFLSTGISSARLEETLGVLRTRMVIFSLMVLLLTVGGVAALLRMNLFLPLHRLMYNLEQAVAGVRERDLPKADQKLGALNRNFRALVKQRDEARDASDVLHFRDREADDRVNQRVDAGPATGHEPSETAGSGQN